MLSPEEKKEIIESLDEFFERHGDKPLTDEERKALRIIGKITPRQRKVAA